MTPAFFTISLIRSLACIVLCFALPLCARGELYIWTDDNGIRHFSNVGPPQTETRVTTRWEGTFSDRSLPGRSFEVLKIYDGDTILVKGMDLGVKIRLVGIDAPETGGRKLKGQPFAAESTRFLKRLLKGRRVTVKSHGIGGYNRPLAEIFVDGLNINLEMVKNGMAEVYRGKRPKSLDEKAYTAAQTSARKNKKGIWSQGRRYKSPRQWRKENPRQ